jgi:hypothetical protein
MVCCRVGKVGQEILGNLRTEGLMVWKNGLKKSVKETEDPVCQVVEEYAPNEKGLAGLDGYNEVKSEVYQGMKETFNPYMDVERE